jgi:hypothetical protein
VNESPLEACSPEQYAEVPRPTTALRGVTSPASCRRDAGRLQEFDGDISARVARAASVLRQVAISRPSRATKTTGHLHLV